MAHALDAGIDFGTGEISGIVLMPIVVAVFFSLVFEAGEKQRLDQVKSPGDR